MCCRPDVNTVSNGLSLSLVLGGEREEWNQARKRECGGELHKGIIYPLGIHTSPQSLATEMQMVMGPDGMGALCMMTTRIKIQISEK